MKRYVVRAALCSVVLALCVCAHAQPSKKVARIGFLAAPTATGYRHNTDAFLQGLRERPEQLLAVANLVRHDHS